MKRTGDMIRSFVDGIYDGFIEMKKYMRVINSRKSYRVGRHNHS